MQGTPLAVAYGRTLAVHRPRGVIVEGEIHRLPFAVPNNNRIVLKLEHLTRYSPTGSLYDRLYDHLFDHYEINRYIQPGVTPLVEGSVGNAGAAFAHTALRRGYRDYTVLLPGDIYPARIDQIRQLGANVIFSPSDTAELGYIEIMEEMVRSAWRGRRRLRGDPERLFPVSKVLRVPNEPYDQIVSETIWSLAVLGFPTNIDFFLFGVGAGNTITEIGKSLKARRRATRVVACEFKENPFVALLRDGKRPPVGGPWPQGQIAETISGVPPEKLHLDLDVIDDVIGVTGEERDKGRRIANDDLGLFAGRPTGGLLHAVLELSRHVCDKNIFTIVFDSVAKYRTSYRPVWDVDFRNHRIIEPPQAFLPIGRIAEETKSGDLVMPRHSRPAPATIAV